MALIGNYSVLSKQPGRAFGGTTQSCDRSNSNKHGAVRNQDYSMDAKSSVPSGYTHPASWSLPQKSGGMASFTRVSAVVSSTANLAAGINIQSSISSSITLSNADLGLIVSLIAALAASGTITDAAANAILDMSADISATGTITTADMGLLAYIVAGLAATLSTTDAELTAIAHMAADILPYTELSPESLARFVWNQDITAFTDTSTAGKKLNDLSGGGASLQDIEDAILNALLADHTVAGSLSVKLQQLLTMAQFIALK